MAIAGAIPAVARDFICFTNTARGEDDCFGTKDFEPPTLAIIAESANDTFAVI